MIVAHKWEDGTEQFLQEHALETAKLAQEFAAAFDCGEMGYAAGLLHDLGKATMAFIYIVNMNSNHRLMELRRWI